MPADSDLTRDTVAVLRGFIDLVENTDRYPTVDDLGDHRTILCLEYAIERVEHGTDSSPMAK